jgi:hypothetical protein
MSQSEPKQQYVPPNYAAQHPESWVWSDEHVAWIAPVPAPNDGYPYIWDEAIVQWVPFPGYPRP